MPFTIVRDDITKMRVDAVVSMTASHVESGTERAVYQAAGSELTARYVLHTAAPSWTGGEAPEETLRASYDAALTLAAQLDCASVAFPLPAGDGAVPREVATRVALGAFTDFLLTHELTIYLVVPDGESALPAGSLFPDVRRYIDEHYAAERPAKAKATGGLFGHPGSRRERRVFGAPLAEDAAPGACAYPAMEERAAEPQELRDYLELAECGFSEYLLDLLKETGEKDADVYRRAGMSRQLFNKIINSRDYQPKKKTAIQLAIGLRLDLAQTQRLLEKAGYALTRSSKSDLVVQYFIQRREYNLVAINLALFDCGLPLLCE